MKRKDANKVEIKVVQDDCKEEVFLYKSREIRLFSLVGTIVSWTTFIVTPIPWGLIVDGINGSLWKPNQYEEGIKKDNYKNYTYTYTVSYTSCNQAAKVVPVAPVSPQIVDVVYLKDGNIIRGVIIEQVIGVSIKIKTKDDSILVFRTEEIERITRE
jgi:hypothetical protein